MNNLKKIVKPLSKISPAIKKVIPSVGNFLGALDLVDNIVRLAKPFVDDVRDKSIEESKKIYAYQINTDEGVRVYKKKVDIEITADTEEEAFRIFVKELNNLRNNRMLSSNKKIQKEQMKLIRKIDDIVKSDEDFKKYLFRIIIETDDLKEAKFKLPKFKRLKKTDK
jgi:hypothetical protein